MSFGIYEWGDVLLWDIHRVAVDRCGRSFRLDISDAAAFRGMPRILYMAQGIVNDLDISCYTISILDSLCFTSQTFAVMCGEALNLIH